MGTERQGPLWRVNVCWAEPGHLRLGPHSPRVLAGLQRVALGVLFDWASTLATQDTGYRAQVLSPRGPAKLLMPSPELLWGAPHLLHFVAEENGFSRAGRRAPNDTRSYRSSYPRVRTLQSPTANRWLCSRSACGCQVATRAWRGPGRTLDSHCPQQ